MAHGHPGFGGEDRLHPGKDSMGVVGGLGQGHHGVATSVTAAPLHWHVDDNELAADFDGSLTGLGTDLSGLSYNMTDALMALNVFKDQASDTSFQYILNAPTSPATKKTEETLTYLNQGQPYEIKVKKLGSLGGPRGRLYKSVCKVCFHDRRLQYMESQQIETWKQTRPGERILDLDLPLSNGILEHKLDPSCHNVVEFVWDASTETSLYIKVNCISTEFTPKKHGGEKGVPFRLQIDTHSLDQSGGVGGPTPGGSGDGGVSGAAVTSRLVHCSSCQIKVFKPKGADRKHKTDREKVDKQSLAVKEKYQPSYDCTMFSNLTLDKAITMAKTTNGGGAAGAPGGGSPGEAIPGGVGGPGSVVGAGGGGGAVASQPVYKKEMADSIAMSPASDVSGAAGPLPLRGKLKPVSADTGPQEVGMWLREQGFSAHVAKSLQGFSGCDLLRLTRDDLIQICGLADGIRMNNALQVKQIRPSLTLYICVTNDIVFHAIYMEDMRSQELVQKLGQQFNFSPSIVMDMCLVGPGNIHILVSDQVIKNIPDQSQYSLELQKPIETTEQYRLLLRPCVKS